jgi:1-deoxy-D-xylulose-5-phosphate reductoisomerase
MKTVSLLGSTGSIGTQTLDVVERFPDSFRVSALGAARCSERLVQQIRLHRPQIVVVATDAAATELRQVIDVPFELLVGEQGLRAAASAGDVVVNAVAGFAGLPVTLAALESGKRLALANKESLIAAAPVVERVRSTPGAEIIPVDSEHCAIHQCLSTLRDADQSGLAKIILTASGGPFRGWSKADLEGVSVEEALAHPTWSMGPKITIDSSTLMNKGLEVIEAHALFDVDYERIDVVVHPQSIVHSMVELVDGSTLAQLSLPDMRLPIAYALGHPDRLAVSYGALDFSRSFALSFDPPDRASFPCLDLAFVAGRLGGAAPAWLSAANEVAVEAFLAGALAWTGIAQVVEMALDRYESDPLDSLEAVLHADSRARDVTSSILAARIER